jgi:hypothetical protein
MATKDQALKARDEIFDRLNRIGTVVLQARLLETNGSWSVEVQVAHSDQPLKALTIEGVAVSILSMNRLRRSERRLGAA